MANPGENEYGVLPQGNFYFEFPFTQKKVVYGQPGVLAGDGYTFLDGSQVEIGGKGKFFCNFTVGKADVEELLPYFGRYMDSTRAIEGHARVSFPETGMGRDFPWQVHGQIWNYYSMPYFFLPGMRIMTRLSHGSGHDTAYTRGGVYAFDESLIGVSGKEINDSKQTVEILDYDRRTRGATVGDVMIVVDSIEYNDEDNTMTLGFLGSGGSNGRGPYGNSSITLPQSYRGFLLKQECDGNCGVCWWSVGGDEIENVTNERRLDDYLMTASATARFRI